jgi:hypothetical protein
MSAKSPASWFYKFYSDELVSCLKNSWNMSSCAYCGEIVAESKGCPACSRKNCMACATKFQLNAKICVEEAVMCPPPHNCSLDVFYQVEDTSKLFGTFGTRVPTCIEPRYKLPMSKVPII